MMSSHSMDPVPHQEANEERRQSLTELHQQQLENELKHTLEAQKQALKRRDEHFKEKALEANQDDRIEANQERRHSQETVQDYRKSVEHLEHEHRVDHALKVHEDVLKQKAHTGIDERETKAEMKRREMEEVQHKKQLELERKAEEAERRRQEHLLQIQQHKSR